MDFPTLVAVNLAANRRPARMDARAEDRYWRDRAALPRPKLRLLAPIAATAGVILLLVGIAQA